MQSLYKVVLDTCIGGWVQILDCLETFASDLAVWKLEFYKTLGSELFIFIERPPHFLYKLELLAQMAAAELSVAAVWNGIHRLGLGGVLILQSAPTNPIRPKVLLALEECSYYESNF